MRRQFRRTGNGDTLCLMPYRHWNPKQISPPNQGYWKFLLDLPGVDKEAAETGLCDGFALFPRLPQPALHVEVAEEAGYGFGVADFACADEIRDGGGGCGDDGYLLVFVRFYALDGL